MRPIPRSISTRTAIWTGPSRKGHAVPAFRTAGAFNRAITNSGELTVEGNELRAIYLNGPLTGHLVQSGKINVLGDRSVGVRTGAVTGIVTIGGSIVAIGEGAVGGGRWRYRRCAEIEGGIARPAIATPRRPPMCRSWIRRSAPGDRLWSSAAMSRAGSRWAMRPARRRTSSPMARPRPCRSDRPPAPS